MLYDDLNPAHCAGIIGNVKMVVEDAPNLLFEPAENEAVL